MLAVTHPNPGRRTHKRLLADVRGKDVRAKGMKGNDMRGNVITKIIRCSLIQRKRTG